MKQIILVVILVLSFSSTSFAKKTNFLFTGISTVKFDEIVRFDEYGKLSLNKEKERLDNLFFSITNDKTVKSLIVFKLNKSDSRKKKLKRFKVISKHLDYRKADKSRITFAFIEADNEQTIVYVEPQDTDLLYLLDLISGETAKHKIIKAEELSQKITELFPKK